MKTMTGVLTLIVIGSGCALPAGGGGPQTDRYDRSSRGYSPLDASIIPVGIGGFDFYVDRPAHVAVFRITPGYGTTMVYPAPGLGRSNGLVYSGRHQFGEWRRSSQYRAPRPYSTVSRQTGMGPQFYLLVASEQPLEMNRLEANGLGIWHQAGWRFRSQDAHSSMQQLVDIAVPRNARPGSWTTDMYVHWPEVLDAPLRDRERRVILTCDGRSYSVPINMLDHARRTLCPVVDEMGPGHGPPKDTAEIAQPDRRTPIAAEPEGRERITEVRGDGTAKPSPVTAPRPRAVPGGGREARPVSVERPEPRERPATARPAARPAAPKARPAAPSARPTSRPAAQPRSTPAPSAPRPAREPAPKCDPCGTS
jgi:hypothetical protein